MEKVIDERTWNLHSGQSYLEPLKFSNGKDQEKIVKEVVSHINAGHKIVFIKGMCGTGKSAIALNIARNLGRASIVVPIKTLQRQYEEDYMAKKHIYKKDGSKMTISMITGRENHPSMISPGQTCADPTLPENIKLTEKNFQQIRSYYLENPYIKSKDMPELKLLKRISIAPANPYWSPIVPENVDLPFKEARKRKYKGMSGKTFVFHHRKTGCSYYDQYNSYIDSDVIIFNAAKYKIEMALDRKPFTDVDIIDEADEFLDSFSNQSEINLSRLALTLNLLGADPVLREKVDKIISLIKLEEKNKQALGIEKDKLYKIEETKIKDILKLIIHPELEQEVFLDEQNYANSAIETAYEFKDYFDDTYVSFYKRENDLCVELVTTNISTRLRELIDKNRAMVFMSGTLHSKEVMEHIFGIKDAPVVEAETINPGTIEICMTGKEFDCKYSNFTSGNKTRKDYLEALNASYKKAKKPILVHVNSFEDLPSMEESEKYLLDIMTKDKLRSLQAEDKTGKLISMFKAKMMESLFTTKCSRGVDFPGDMCNSIIFTKYPNPNVQGTFWKILQKTHPDYFWDFYRDKAWREFLQRIYRAVRSQNDHVIILSPDIRVLNAVRQLQLPNKNL